MHDPLAAKHGLCVVLQCEGVVMTQDEAENAFNRSGIEFRLDPLELIFGHATIGPGRLVAGV